MNPNRPTPEHLPEDRVRALYELGKNIADRGQEESAPIALDEDARRYADIWSRTFQSELPEPMAFDESAVLTGIHVSAFERRVGPDTPESLQVTFRLVEPDLSGEEADEFADLTYFMHETAGRISVDRMRFSHNLLHLLEESDESDWYEYAVLEAEIDALVDDPVTPAEIDHVLRVLKSAYQQLFG